MHRVLVIILTAFLVLSQSLSIHGFMLDEGYRIVWEEIIGSGSAMVDLSSDGKYVAATNFSSLLLYDSNGRLLWIGYSYGCGFSYETLPVISTNNKYILYGSYYRPYQYSSNDTIRYFVALYALNGSMIWCRRISAGVIDLAVLSNGTSIVATRKWIAFIGRNGVVYNNISKIPFLGINSPSVAGMALAENRGRIAIAYMDGFVVITNTRGDIYSYILLNDSLRAIDIDDKGRYIATGGHKDTAYFFDVNGTLLWSYNVDNVVYGNVTIIAMSRDAKYIYVGTDIENGLLAFNSKGKLLWYTKLYNEYIIDMKTTANGSFLLVITNRGVKLFDNKGNLLWYFKPPDNSTVVSADISSDGRYIVVSAHGRVYYIENLITNKPPSSPPYTGVIVLIGNYTIRLNETILVNITVLNASNIAGGFITISFNNSTINIIDVLAGDLGQPIYNILGNGTIKIATAQASALNRSIGIFATLLVKGMNKGTTPLTIVKAELNDEEGNLIKPQVLNGSITVTEYLKGDVNHNGRLDTGDATLILQMIVGLRPPDLLGDLNGNGKLDTGDVTLLLRIIVGLEG